MTKTDKLHKILSIIFRIFLVFAIISALLLKNWFNLSMSLLSLFLTFLPSIFQKRFKVYYPSEFEIMILIFIFGSLYLGEVKDFYGIFWWWDIFLHTLSGMIIGFFAFSLVYILNKELSEIRLSPFFISLFSFSFALAMGVIWEMFEFTMDNVFHVNMQRRETGVFDTMTDLIVDGVGALLISAAGFLYLKNGKGSFLSDRFTKKNAHLFKK
jgi:hypothetical protein